MAFKFSVLVSCAALNAVSEDFPPWQWQYSEESISKLFYPQAHTVSHLEGKKKQPVCRLQRLHSEELCRGLDKVIEDPLLIYPPELCQSPLPSLLCTSQNRAARVSWRAWLHPAHLSVSKAIIIPPGEVVNPLRRLTGAGQFWDYL